MVASPFLNVLYRHLSPAGRSRLMAVGFVVLSLIPTLTIVNPIGSNLVWFFYLYLLGGWIRDQKPAKSKAEKSAGLCLLDPLRIVNRPGAALSFLGGVGFVWASMAVIGWAQRAWGFSLISPDYFIWQYMVPTFLASVGLMLLFTRLKMPNSRLVNTAASCALGVYLIHDNPFMRAWLWPHLTWVYPLGPAAILLVGAASAVATYAPCGLIDYARIQLLEKPLLAVIESKLGESLKRADRWLSDLDDYLRRFER